MHLFMFLSFWSIFLSGLYVPQLKHVLTDVDFRLKTISVLSKSYLNILNFFSVVDLKTGNGGVVKEAKGNHSPKADCTLTLSETDLISLVWKYFQTHCTMGGVKALKFSKYFLPGQNRLTL